MRSIVRTDNGYVTTKANSFSSTHWQDVLASQGREREFVWPDLSQYTNQINVYAASPFVFKAISLVAKNAAVGEFHVFRRVKERKEAVPNHDIELLLNKPNGWQSSQEFKQAIVTDYLINGNAYIYMANDGGGAQPNEMMLLRPDCVKIVPDTSGKSYVRGYVYSVNNRDIPLDANQVIHWKEHNPTDPYYGLSRIQIAQLSIQAEHYMSAWQRNFFGKENAVPAGVVAIKSIITEGDYEKLKADWQKTYGGTKRATAFIRGDVQYSNMGTSHVDMDFLQGRQFEKELIFLMFDVPPGVLDKNSTEANAQAGLEILTNYAVWPLQVGLGQKLSTELCPFWSDDLELLPDDIRVKDETQELKKLQAYAPYLEINEVRADFLDKEPKDWGELPAAGAAAAVQGEAAFGKPQLDQSPQQIDSGKGIDLYTLRRALKAFATDASRRWFFANNPQFAHEGSTPHLQEGASRESHRQQLEQFVETRKNRVTNHLWDTGMVEYNNKAQVVVNHQKTKEAAADMVKDVRDASYPRAYLVQSFAEAEGHIGLTQQQQEGRLNAHYADKARATLLAAHVGDVKLTEAQYRRLQSVSQGNYLKDKYSQYASGNNGTLIGVQHERLRAMSEDAQRERADRARDFRQNIRKSYDDFDDIDVPRVYITSAMRQEFAQFAKRARKGDFAVSAFKFNSAPLSIEISMKALADVGLLDTIGFKAKTAPRISISGDIDPNAKAKDKFEKLLANAVEEQLADTQQRVIAAIRHETRASKTKLPDNPKLFKDALDDDFWNQVGQRIAKALKPIIQDMVHIGMTDQYDVLQVGGLGIKLDPTEFNIDAANYAQQWTDSWLAEFGVTTRKSVGALLTRWIGTPGARLEDLVSAIQESNAFSEARARMVAVTEATRAFAQAEYNLADRLADIAGVDLGIGISAFSDMVPLHPNCRCWVTMQFQYDDESDPTKITGIDFIWRTANDDTVCQVCAPRNDRLVSDIANG